MDFSKFTDPKVFGPGVWFLIHTCAKESITEDKKRFFVSLLQLIERNLGCEKCKLHMSEYMKNNPINPYWNLINEKKEQIGMFNWSWKFHNSVNSKLSRPILDWETAYSMYYETPSICSKGCDESDQEIGLSLIKALDNSYFTKGSNNNIISKPTKEIQIKFTHRTK